MPVEALQLARIAVRDCRSEDAVSICRAVLEESPDHAEALRLLGVAHAGREEYETACRLLERAVALDESQALWWGDLGAVQWKSGLPSAARTSFQRGLDLDGTLPHLAAGYCKACLDCDLLPEEKWASQWVEAWPDSREAREVLAAVHKEAGNLVAALDLAREIARDHPALYRSWLRVAAAAAELGESGLAAAMCARTAAMEPDYEENRSTLIYLMLFRPEFSAAAIRQECVKWARGESESSPPPIPGDRGPGAAIRVAVPASEFTSHSAACFLAPLLEAMDRTRVHVTGYNTRPAGNRVVGQFRLACDEWREVHGWSDREIAARMHRDGSTVVLDISGHFQKNRLSLFRQRLAPVQLAYPNYPGTTGLTTFDALITDQWCSPRGSEEEYTEPLRRMRNGYLVYRAPEAAPSLGALPCDGNRRITFGVFQQLAKTTPDFWRSIAAILRAVPDSELIYHHALTRVDEPGNPERMHILRLLESYAIAPARVRLAPLLPIGSHMALLAEADIALDTTPFSGQTTTFESLWMGVPVVAHSGDRHAGRITSAVACRLGLESWVAHSWQQYVDLAIEKASQIDELRQLRRNLRGTMQSSLFCNPHAVADEIVELMSELAEAKSARAVTA